MNNTISALIVSMSLILFCGCGPSTSKYTLTERQQIIDDLAADTIQHLCEEEPSAKQQLDNAAGYGVFSNANVNVIFASFGGGYGVVMDKEGRKTYMKMGMGGLGLGIGVKDYRQALIFRDSNTLQSFVDKGWEFGGHADAAAKAGQTGGELSGEGDINDDIIVYSMTETGLALQATVTGAKYWKSTELN
ncbi:MAG: YSC84-related protein [Anaerohalosphaeraceae bacterium]